MYSHKKPGQNNQTSYRVQRQPVENSAFSKDFPLLRYATAGNCTDWAVFFPPLLPRPVQVSPAFLVLPLLTDEIDVLRNADREYHQKQHGEREATWLAKAEME